MSERDFWYMKPRTLIMLMREKRKQDINKMKLLTYFVYGNSLDDEEEEEEDGILGIDRPDPEGALSWASGIGATYGR
jgi:hypothetical protein